MAGILTEFYKTHGWCQGYARQNDGSACLLGALIGCGLRPNSFGRAVAERRLEIAAHHETGNVDFINFNDRAGMTKPKILAFLRKHGL